MNRVQILVEGYTERDFVQEILAPVLSLRQVHVTAPVIGKPGHKGGARSWESTCPEIMAALKHTPVVSTMFDYYAMPLDWPGRCAAQHLAMPARALTVEEEMGKAVTQVMGESFDPRRFVPYVELHEFEAMLFSDASKLAQTLQKPNLTDYFQGILNEFGGPEAINDGLQTAPSKRILHAVPRYDKRLDGILAASNIGLDRIRNSCPHFAQWLTRLENL